MHKFETGKTYTFHQGNGGAHYRGKVLRRTKRTIVVEFSTKGTCALHHLLYEDDASDVKPTTLRIDDSYAGEEHAITHKAGKRRCTTLEAWARGLAVEQM